VPKNTANDRDAFDRIVASNHPPRTYPLLQLSSEVSVDGELNARLRAALEPIAEVFTDLLASVLAKKLEIIGQAGSGPITYDYNDAARRLSMSKSKLRKLVHKNAISHVKAEGQVLFRPADLEAYLEERVRSPERAGVLARRARGTTL
jgi:excisionase family DNA binding protein